jgi:hypothetical protein
VRSPEQLAPVLRGLAVNVRVERVRPPGSAVLVVEVLGLVDVGGARASSPASSAGTRDRAELEILGLVERQRARRRRS